MIASAVFIVSCGKSKPTLHLYIWGDYISPEVVENFENEFNCTVKIDIFDSNEAMYAKLKAGAGGYDVVVPSSYTAVLMNKQNMLLKLDHSLLPNVTRYFDKSYSNLLLDRDLQFSVPYFVSFTGIGYNTKRVPDFEASWAMFEKNNLASRCSLLNDMREVIGVSLIRSGHSPNSTDPAEIEQAVEQALQWKKNIAKFEVDDA